MSKKYGCDYCETYKSLEAFPQRQTPNGPKPNGRKCIDCKDAELLEWKKSHPTWHLHCPDRLVKHHGRDCTTERII